MGVTLPRLWILLAYVTAAFAQIAVPPASPVVPDGMADSTQPRRIPDILKSTHATPTILLPSLFQEKQTGKQGPLTRIGVRQSMPKFQRDQFAASTTPDGRAIRSLAIRSSGAVGVRVHFRNFDAGDGEVWVFSPDATLAPAPFSGKGVFGDGEFWSPVIEGDRAIVAFIGRDASMSGFPFEMDAMVHLWGDPMNPSSASAPPQADGAATCHLDVTCYPQYANYASAVGRYSFISDAGGVHVCSGALINTRSSSFKPYFLTAHHCIASNSEARTMDVRFQYQTSTCNGPAPDLASAPRVQGATYLAGASLSGGDYALVQLNATPGGSWFLGWDHADPALGASLMGIHHPAGSYKRISFGTRGYDRDVTIGDELAPADSYYRIDWSGGVTQGGSSGSPLVDATGRIRGTLTGGPIIPQGSSACEVQRYGIYGRFEKAYPAFQPYLEDAGSVTISANPQSLRFEVINGAAPDPQSLSVTATSPSPIVVNAQSNQSWLRVNSGSIASAQTPANLLVSVDTASLTAAGTYSGSISISSSSAATVVIGVTVNVTAKPSSVTLIITPNPVYQQSPDADGFTWFYTVKCIEQAGVNTRITGFKIGGTDYSSQVQSWFGTASLNAFGSVSASFRARGYTVPANLLVEVQGMDAGSNRPWQAINTLQLLGPAAPSISLSRSALTFAYTKGSSDPQPQQVAITNTGGGSLQWTATSDSAWLSVTPPSGTAPSAVNISVKPSQLASGTYSGKITIAAPGAGSQNIAVSLTVSALASPPIVGVSTTNLTFSYKTGTSAPSPQTVGITNMGGGVLNWTASASHAWIKLSPLTGTAPSNISVQVDPTGLANGSHTGAILVGGVGTNAAMVVVNFYISGSGDSIAGIVEPAGYKPGAVCAGCLASIFGSGLATGTFFASSVPLGTSLGGVSVTFNGRPAPLLYVSPQQINVQVPVEVSGTVASVIVNTPGWSFPPFMVSLAKATPGILTQNGSPTGPALAVNASTGELVGKSNAAPRGGYVTIYTTGLGPVTPAVTSGTAAPSSPLAVTTDPVTVLVGGVPATVLFSGMSPGFVGLYQVNIQVPGATQPGSDVDLRLSVSGASSNAVTIAVR